MTTKNWTLVAAVLGSGIVFLDSTIVNVALVRLGHELPSTFVGVLEGQAYVTGGYLVVLSALLILAGGLADFYGRRRMFSIGLAGFGISSALCGVAPNLELLILFRLVQGAAGALLVPGSLALLTSVFRGEEQGRAIGVWAAASAATTTLGPAVGGLLVDTISWRAAFLINVPLVILAFYATARHVPESRNEEASGRFDWPGAVVIALAVGGLAFGAIRGQATDWSESIAIIAIIVGLVCTLVFPLLEIRSANPLVPLRLFRSRNFTTTNLSTLVIYGALYGSSTFQALFFQGTAGYTALAAGLAGLPVGVILALFSTRVGTLAGRHGPRLFMTVGPAIMTIGLLWFARVPADTAPWLARPESPASLVPSSGYLVDVLPGMLLFAIGLCIMVAPLTTALMASVPSANAGVASAINNAISRVGAPLVSAIIFIAITGSYWATLGANVPGLDVSRAQVRSEVPPLNKPTATVPVAVAQAADSASTDAFHLAMLVSAGLTAGGAIVNGLGIRNRRREETVTLESTSTEGAT